jgi:cysteinyl-tRNA synthetase
MKIYNTLTHQKEEFIPLEPGKVKIYACGPTVYNYFHLGNARPFITFDTLRRFLEYRGYEVTFVQNFTDIDDKMIQRAREEGITVRELADRYIEEYYYDADRLNIKRATHQPRATDSMTAIIDLIQTLLDKGFAYVSEDGVYFETDRYEEYGKLSGHNPDDLRAGASNRVGENESKRNPMDFAIWKFKKEGEPSWPAPWGEGRPGWHIECSAMIRQYLGDTIDIHGGGQDLIFPHHENEIAQTECATGKPFVRYWMHNGFITVDREKMSKSLGNFFTVRDIAKVYPYDVIRFFMLTGHYRGPIDFHDQLLKAAETGLQRIRTCSENLQFTSNSRASADLPTDAPLCQELRKGIKRHKEQFIQAMEDDLNTADALAAIFELVRLANTAAADQTVASAVLREAREQIIELCDVLGLVVEDQTKPAIPEAVLRLVEERTAAKAERNFTKADELRDRIAELGYKVEDTPEGPKVLPQ